MDRDTLIQKITTLEQGYLVLQTTLSKLQGEVEVLKDAERSWAIWSAKVGAIPVAVSIALAIVSVIANVDASEHRKKMVEAAKKIETLAPRGR